LYRGINDLNRVTSLEIIKNEKGYLFTDSYIILARWWNHFSAIQCTWGCDVRQTEIRTLELLVAEMCVFEVEMAI
jgi:hypothetical protein